MDQITLSQISREINRAAEEAADFIRSQVGKVAVKDIEAKERNSLVSYVDKRAEQMLVEALTPLVEAPGFITEEETVLNRKSEYTWIIDPLDGTTNFLQQIPIFSVSVGLAHMGEIVAGTVVDVMQGDTYWAFKGGGAWRNEESIFVSRTNEMREAVIATGFPYFSPDELERLAILFRDMLKSSRAVRRLGSAALDLTYVACGKFDGFYETTLNPWDIAAGTILVREAGGRITDFALEEDFVFKQELIASNGILHNSIAKLLDSYAHTRT